MEIKESAVQLILTGRVGDGHIANYGNSPKACATYTSIDRDYIIWKAKILRTRFSCGDVKTKDNSAGFNKNGIIHLISTHVSEEIYNYLQKPREDIIDMLDYFGFMVYYFDDGSWHKNRKIMNLYCNTFNEKEIKHLQVKMFELFGGKFPSVYYDKKKDGRTYPYLYIPRIMVDKIVMTYKEYVTTNLPTMLYKLGLPSQTIESQQ